MDLDLYADIYIPLRPSQTAFALRELVATTMYLSCSTPASAIRVVQLDERSRSNKGKTAETILLASRSIVALTVKSF